MGFIKYNKEPCIAREKKLNSPWREAVLYRNYFADGSDAIRLRGKIDFMKANEYEIRSSKYKE